MKKEQKIIEIRRAAKLKVAEIETKIAVARSEAAEKRARLMCDRAADLEGLEACSTERLDVLAKYRVHSSWIEAGLSAEVAECKLEIQQTREECERQCSAVEDDDTEPSKEQPQQDTVYCDGSEHSARIVARRLINKMPHIPRGGYLFIHIIQAENGEYFVTVSESGETTDKYITFNLSKGDGEKEEAGFVQRAREMFKTEDDEAGGKAAEPMPRALDALFGGNPVEQADNLISDTDKDGKEGENE